MSLSLLQMKQYTRSRTNTEQNLAITDQALGFYLNMGLGSLYDIIATEYEDYNVLTYLSTLNGSNQIPLPPDFFKLRGVDYGGPGFWTTVFGYGLQERNRFNNPIANMVVPYGNQAGRKFRVMNDSLYIEPENLAMGQYQVWYVPKYHIMYHDTDTLIPAMDSNAWVEYAVASAGVKIYNSLNLPTAGFMQEMAYHEEKVRASCANRDDAGPQCVQNTRNISDWSFPFSGSGGGFAG